MKTTSKMKTTWKKKTTYKIKTVPGPSLHSPSCPCFPLKSFPRVSIQVLQLLWVLQLLQHLQLPQLVKLLRLLQILLNCFIWVSCFHCFICAYNFNSCITWLLRAANNWPLWNHGPGLITWFNRSWTALDEMSPLISFRLKFTKGCPSSGWHLPMNS